MTRTKRRTHLRQAVVLLGLLAILGDVGPAGADDTVELESKIAPNEPIPFEEFGGNVDLSGDLAVVQPGGFSTVGDTVYIFRRDPEDPTQWNQEAKLPAPSDWAGWGTAVPDSNDTVVISVSGYDHPFSDCGAVFVYERVEAETVQWVQTAILQAPVPELGQRFGSGVAFDGDRIAVPTQGRWGLAYIFERDGDTWTSSEVNMPPPILEPFYGGEGIWGDTAAFGQVDAVYNGSRVGAVFVYERTPEGLWRSSAVLRPSYPAHDASFGAGVEVGDGVIVVRQARGRYPEIFRKIGSVWVQEADLRPEGYPAGGYARSVALGDDVVAVSSPWESNDGGITSPGLVYLFARHKRGIDRWGQVARYLPSDAQDYDEFGRNVEMDGTLLMAGSPRHDAGGPNAGAAYVANLRLELVDLVVDVLDSADPVIAGSGTGNLEYEMTLTNAGAEPASGISLAVDIAVPPDTTIESWSTTGDTTFDGTYWRVDDLPAAESERLIFELTVGPSTPRGVDVAMARISVHELNETLFKVENDVDTEMTSVEVLADVAIAGHATSNPVAAGDTIEYQMTVSDLGPSDAQNVVVHHTIPADTTFLSTTGCQEDPEGFPACTLGRVDANSDHRYSLIVKSFSYGTGTVIMTADAESPTPDPDAGNNSMIIATTVIQDLIFGDFFELGDTSSWSSTVP